MRHEFLHRIAGSAKRLGRQFNREEGQDAFEYLLTVGAVAVVSVAGLILGFEVLVPKVVAYVCPSVDTASNVISSVGSCISNLP